MLQAAGTAKGDDRLGIATDLKHPTVVQDLDLTPHWRQAFKPFNLLMDIPVSTPFKEAQLLQRHRLQIVARGGRRGGLVHFLPLGSNGSRLVLVGEGPAVAGCICLSRIC